MNVESKINAYIAEHPQWSSLLKEIRKVLSHCALEATIKWGAPVYTLGGKNIVGIGAFKGYAGVWFYQGALLTDPLGVLINAQEGKTKAMRQWRFTHNDQFSAKHLKAYIQEAIQNHQEGREIKASKPRSKPLEVPLLLQEYLDRKAPLADRFNSMGLTRKREFADYISEAKQNTTKERRLKKVIACIKAGRGLYEKV